jgi:integral membrane sensor domain MASE1
MTGNLLWFGNSLSVALLIVSGNIAESVIGASLIGRFVGWPFRLETLREVFGLVLVGALCAPVVAGVIGGLTLMWSEGQPWGRAFSLFWIGDATGVLVAAPIRLTVVDSWRRDARPSPQRVPEAATLATGRTSS